MKFNFTERFTCPCGETWVFRATSLTELVANAKQACNGEIQAHYVDCPVDKAIEQAEKINKKIERIYLIHNKLNNKWEKETKDE